MNKQEADARIVFEDVSKFYGEVLGVNRVNLSIPAGITSLVGAQRLGQNDVDELDDRVDSAHLRAY